MWRRFIVMPVIAAAAGCSDEPTAQSPPGLDAGVDAGQTACAPGELPEDDGGCRAAGIPDGSCGAGFVSDGASACDAVLPPERCPDGTIATPGETACHAVAPCAPGTWGDIPTDATTEHVDATYSGVDSDGSATKPWPAIQAAIDAAAPGAIVAVAEGTYTGDLEAVGSVRIWGRCPGLVAIVGDGTAGAVVFDSSASTSELRGVSVSGGDRGVLAGSSVDLLLDRVWIHDTGMEGVLVTDDARVTLRASLVERTAYAGILVLGAEIDVEASVFRGTQPAAVAPFSGVGVAVQALSDRARAGLTSSIIEDAHGIGLLVAGADVTLEGCVVRDTRPIELNQEFGRGASVQIEPSSGELGRLVLSRSNVERNREYGVFALGSDIELEAAVVRDTAPRASDLRGGTGLQAEWDTIAAARAHAVVRGSVLERNRNQGAAVWGADAVLESTIVRGTLPQAADDADGVGVFALPRGAERAVLTLAGSVVEDNREVGVFVSGSDAALSDTVVQRTLPEAALGLGGIGVGIQHDFGGSGAPSTATIRRSLVEDSLGFGIVVVASVVTIDDTVVRRTLPQAADAAFGDGIASVSFEPLAETTLHRVRVEDSSRAGVVSFGAHVGIGDSVLECNGIDLDGDDVETFSFVFDDLGGNTCGCNGVETPCQVVSANLAAPDGL